MQLPVVAGHYYRRDDGLMASAVSAPSQAEADRWTLTGGDIPMPDEDVDADAALAEIAEVIG